MDTRVALFAGYCHPEPELFARDAICAMFSKLAKELRAELDKVGHNVGRAIAAMDALIAARDVALHSITLAVIEKRWADGKS